MIKLPFNVDINNLIDDLRVYSWEAADIFLFYSKMVKDSNYKNKIIQSKNSEDPITLADLKVNELIINRITSFRTNPFIRQTLVLSTIKFILRIIRKTIFKV